MKKEYSLVTVLVIISISVDGGMIFHSRSQEKPEEKKALRVGISFYRGDDSFINNLCGKIEGQAKVYGRATGIRVILDVVGRKGGQNTQNSQVDRFVSLDVDVLCVSMVDRLAASYIINRMMEGDTPVVFFNRESVEGDMNRWEKLYYTGENARESAVPQGNVPVDAYKKGPSILDLNGDEKVSYVLLEDGTSYQDSLIRTERPIQTLKDDSVPLEEIIGGIGNWGRNQGSAWVEKWLEEYPDEIELVISNNDDMVLGAADALERKEVTRPIKIVRTDGAPQGVRGPTSGKLFGTVQCDSDEYADMVFRIVTAAGLKYNVQGEVNLGDGRYYNCSQTTLTANAKQWILYKTRETLYKSEKNRIVICSK